MFCVSVGLLVCIGVPGPPLPPSTVEFNPEGPDHVDAVDDPRGESRSGAFVAQCTISQQGHSSSGIMK